MGWLTGKTNLLTAFVTFFRRNFSHQLPKSDCRWIINDITLRTWNNSEAIKFHNFKCVESQLFTTCCLIILMNSVYVEIKSQIRRLLPTKDPSSLSQASLTRGVARKQEIITSFTWFNLIITESQPSIISPGFSHRIWRVNNKTFEAFLSLLTTIQLNDAVSMFSKQHLVSHNSPSAKYSN